MDKYTVGTFDVSTNNLIIRNMTTEEIEQLKMESATEVAKQEEQEALAATRASSNILTMEKLAAIGLTADEITALFKQG